MQAQHHKPVAHQYLTIGEMVLSILNLFVGIFSGLGSIGFFISGGMRTNFFAAFPLLFVSLSLVLATVFRFMGYPSKRSFKLQLLAIAGVPMLLGFGIWQAAFTVDEDGDTAALFGYCGIYLLSTIPLAIFAWFLKRMDKSE